MIRFNSIRLKWRTWYRGGRGARGVLADQLPNKFNGSRGCSIETKVEAIRAEKGACAYPCAAVIAGGNESWLIWKKAAVRQGESDKEKDGTVSALVRGQKGGGGGGVAHASVDVL